MYVWSQKPRKGPLCFKLGTTGKWILMCSLIIFTLSHSHFHTYRLLVKSHFLHCLGIVHWCQCFPLLCTAPQDTEQRTRYNTGKHDDNNNRNETPDIVHRIWFFYRLFYSLFILKILIILLNIKHQLHLLFTLAVQWIENTDNKPDDNFLIETYSSSGNMDISGCLRNRVKNLDLTTEWVVCESERDNKKWKIFSSPVHATCLARLTLLDFITAINIW
jgi:hypothetical protein